MKLLKHKSSEFCPKVVVPLPALLMLRIAFKLLTLPLRGNPFGKDLSVGNRHFAFVSSPLVETMAVRNNWRGPGGDLVRLSFTPSFRLTVIDMGDWRKGVKPRQWSLWFDVWPFPENSVPLKEMKRMWEIARSPQVFQEGVYRWGKWEGLSPPTT